MIEDLSVRVGEKTSRFSKSQPDSAIILAWSLHALKRGKGKVKRLKRRKAFLENSDNCRYVKCPKRADERGCMQGHKWPARKANRGNTMI